jgi:hypothetical protein
MGEGTDAEPDTAPLAAIRTAIGLGSDAAPVKVLDQGSYRAKLQIAGEDDADRLRLLGHPPGFFGALAASAVAPTRKNTNTLLTITFNIKMPARRGRVLAKPAKRPSGSMAGSKRKRQEELVACHPSNVGQRE